MATYTVYTPSKISPTDNNEVISGRITRKVAYAGRNYAEAGQTHPEGGRSVLKHGAVEAGGVATRDGVQIPGPVGGQLPHPLQHLRGDEVSCPTPTAPEGDEVASFKRNESLSFEFFTHTNHTPR